ncbi:MAG: hypothetical protein ACQKBU_10500 [Verrucomicrobiales bacterium]
MRRSFIVYGIVALCLGFLGVRIVQRWRERFNPYIDQGLVIEWKVGGATSSYPWIEVGANYDGRRYPCDFHFGGIMDPRLRFRDFDGDGRRDIIFEDDQLVQAVAFFPGSGGNPPRFKLLHSDVDWP